MRQSTRKQFSKFSYFRSTTSKDELIILTSTGLGPAAPEGRDLYKKF